MTKIGGNGTETYVYYYSDGSVSISEVNWYIGDVAGVYAATASKAAYEPMNVAYTDVADDAWYTCLVDYVSRLALMNGLGSKIFGPDRK